MGDELELEGVRCVKPLTRPRKSLTFVFGSWEVTPKIRMFLTMWGPWPPGGLMMCFRVAALGWGVSAQPHQGPEPKVNHMGDQSGLVHWVDLKRDTGHQGSGELHGSAIPHVLQLHIMSCLGGFSAIHTSNGSFWNFAGLGPTRPFPGLILICIFLLL